MDFREYIQERIELPERTRICDLVPTMQQRPGATEPEDKERAAAIEHRVLYVYLTPGERHALHIRHRAPASLRAQFGTDVTFVPPPNQ